MRIVIVGAGAAGISAAEALRRRGHDGALVLVGSEPHLPYDRPPLSKQVLSGQWSADRASLRSHEEVAALDLDLRLVTTAVAMRPTEHHVTLDDGKELPYDKLVIATGVSPRRLPFGHDLGGVHVLRTLEDTAGLHAELAPGRRLLVVGAGFLGTEVAATARGLGCEVLVVDPLDAPLVRGLGSWMGGLVRELHAEQGVPIRVGTGVDGLVEDGGAVSRALLSDGTQVDVDLVLVAIGSDPATGWLGDSGLRLDDGVLCDEFLMAAPDVVAIGDIARWPHRGFGTTLRLEHRMNATEQAGAAAANLLAESGERTRFEPVPYFWSDQYDHRIQAYGITPPTAQVDVVSGDPAERSFIATYSVGGRLVGAVGWNRPRDMRALRRRIGEWGHALSAADSGAAGSGR